MLLYFFIDIIWPTNGFKYFIFISIVVLFEILYPLGYLNVFGVEEINCKHKNMYTFFFFFQSLSPIFKIVSLFQLHIYLFN